MTMPVNKKLLNFLKSNIMGDLERRIGAIVRQLTVKYSIHPALSRKPWLACFA
jgi:hypothetical protein